jgi:hypothetical protein
MIWRADAGAGVGRSVTRRPLVVDVVDVAAGRDVTAGTRVVRSTAGGRASAQTRERTIGVSRSQRWALMEPGGVPTAWLMVTLPVGVDSGRCLGGFA